MPASKAATRLSPLDGKNLNRCFPGQADGTRHGDDRALSHDRAVSAGRHRDRHSHRRPQRRLLSLCPHAPGRRSRAAATNGGRHAGLEYATSRFSTPTLPARDCCRSRPNGRGRSSSPPRWAAANRCSAAVHRLTQERPAERAGSLRVCSRGAADPRRASVCRRRAGCRRSTATTTALPRSRAFTRPCCRWEPRWRPASRWGRSISWSGPIASRSRSWRRRPGVLLATRGPSLVAQGDCVACIAHDVDPAILE